MAQSGFTPISLYYSSTGAAVPSAGNLVAGELALNTNDGKLYYKNSSGVVTLLAGATSGPAGGSTTQVQYNNAGVLAGITGATTNGTALTLVAPVLGTPASGVATNLTGLPLTTGVTGTLPVANGGTGLTAGTSGGVLAYTATGTLASSGLLAASALVLGGGAGAAPATTTTGTGVVTALGVNTGTAGAFVVNGGALGTPASGTVTNLTGTASININGTVGATTPAAGAFTTVSASGSATFVTTSGSSGNLVVGSGTTSTNKNFLCANGGSGATGGSGLILQKNGIEIGELSAASTLFGGTSSDLTLYTASGNNFNIYNASLGGQVASFSSTGLAVTGTLTSTLDATIYGLTVGRGGGAVSTNTAVGASALAANSTSTFSTAIGYRALASNTTATGYNTALGGRTLYSNLTGQLNTAAGESALYFNDSGSSNSAFGEEALKSNTSASNNTAVGYQAGYSNITGAGNSFVGTQAGYNVSGDYNTAIGYISGGQISASSGSFNSWHGCTAGRFISSGSNNTGMGAYALYSNTTASENTAVGYQAGYGTTTQAQSVFVGSGAGYTGAGTSVAVGYQALYSATQPAVAVGWKALNANAAGTGNTGVGTQALSLNIGANRNTALGYQALRDFTLASGNGYNIGVGYQALYTVTGTNNTGVGFQTLAATSGNSNIALGHNSGSGITSGSSNVIIGSYSGSAAPISATGNNYIVLSDGDGNPRAYWNGAAATFNGGLTVTGTLSATGVLANMSSLPANMVFVASSNGVKQSLFVKNDDSVGLYSLGTGTVTCSSGVLGFTSDERIKIDDGNYSGGLNAVLNITPKYFYYKNSEGNKDETKGRELGFFAQNIQQTCGLEVVHQPEDPDALLGIHDRGVMAVLVSAIQEQQAIITALTTRITALEAK